MAPPMPMSPPVPPDDMPRSAQPLRDQMPPGGVYAPVTPMPPIAPLVDPVDSAASGYAELPQASAPMGEASQGEVGTSQWRIDHNGYILHPLTALDVLSGLSEKVSQGEVTEYQPLPLRFSPLDRTLGGGIRAGELMLIGGAQGTGKTTRSLQMARNMAQSGQANVLYVCFEHDEEYLLGRLMAMESALAGAMPPSHNSAVKIQDVRREVLGTWLAQGAPTADSSADLRANPRLRPALERIARYGQSLFLLRGSHAATTAANLRALIEAYRRDAPDRPLVVFVDYLQRVPVVPDPPSESEKVTMVVAG